MASCAASLHAGHHRGLDSNMEVVVPVMIYSIAASAHRQGAPNLRPVSQEVEAVGGCDMTAKSELEQIREALENGKLSIPDEEGYRRFIFARCPSDGQEASVYMVERSGGKDTITRVVFRCPVCGRWFDSSPEEMALR